MPGLDEEDDEPRADTDAYDPTTTPNYESGDWPLHAGTYALDELPEDLDDLVQAADSMPTAPFVYSDPADEAHFVREARSRGYDVRRGDNLVARLDPHFP
jgi:hypothetical protein